MGIELQVTNSFNDKDTLYLPHGVTTLAILVNNRDSIFHKIIVRPTHRSEPPDYVAYESSKNVHDNSNTRNLKIIWGGGMTQGYQLDLHPNERKKIFYLIIHDSEDVANYSFIIEAIEVTDGGGEAGILGMREINLLPPRPVDYDDLVRMVVTYNGGLSRTAEFKGDLITSYKSRWFGNNYGYSFIKSSDHPDFNLHYEERGHYISGDIEIEVNDSKNVTTIAEIGGDLERSKIRAELFHFVDNYYVLRIWLYWINDFFEGNQVIGGRTGAGTRSTVKLNSQLRRTTDTTELGAWKQKVIEVPDAERFDLIFSNEHCKVVFVGTDLHWQETWWYTNNNKVRLRFANLDTVPVLITRLPEILERYVGNRTDQQDPSVKVKYMLSKKQQDTTTIDSSLIITESSPTGQYPMNTKLGHGIYRKHVPYVIGSALRPEYSSHDVREF